MNTLRKASVHSRHALLTLVGILGLGLAGCSGAPAAPADTATPDSSVGDGHGTVAGAAEVPEPQLGLTAIDAEGSVTHLDLLDESVTDLGRVAAPSAVSTDGRYLFAHTEEGVEVVDSGVWTWDHVDHFHYYRAAPRIIGVVPGEGPAVVATSNLSTSGSTGVFFEGSGEAVLVDTEALSRGEIRERFRLDLGPQAGMVVPVGSFALVTEGNVVNGYSADGETTGTSEPCIDPAGTITTRVGAVIGCADGALLASAGDDGLRLERIPYPAGTDAPPAVAFANREGRPTVAALADPGRFWLLDTRERAWTLLSAPAPLVQVTAVDDEAGHVLALTTDGRMLVLSDHDGSVLAETAPLVGASLADGATTTLIADQQRAYLGGPREKKLFEIDFADGARLARTFDTVTEPAFVAETGR
jgi:hypothetical protein